MHTVLPLIWRDCIIFPAKHFLIFTEQFLEYWLSNLAAVDDLLMRDTDTLPRIFHCLDNKLRGSCFIKNAHTGGILHQYKNEGSFHGVFSSCILQAYHQSRFFFVVTDQYGRWFIAVDGRLHVNSCRQFIVYLSNTVEPPYNYIF